jgi:hypothetical protein
VTVLLVPVPLPAAGRQTADVPQEQADLPLNLRGAATPREAASTAVPAPAAPLAASAAAHGREPGPGPDLTSVSRLPAAADLCAALARVQRSRDLPALLSHVCRVLDAQGIIVWLADPDQQSLAPALHYGYRPEALERLGNVPSDARNPTADAFRRQEPRVIDGGAGGQGAVVIPLISANGCAGVVTVELRHGVVPDSSIVSLARIFVAQLAGFVAPAAVAEPTVEVASRKLEVGS